MRQNFSISLALLLLALAPQKLGAQQAGEWHVQSRASQAPAPGVSIDVQAAGGSERADAAANAAASALRTKGFGIAGDSDLILRVHVDEGPAPPAVDPRYGLAAQGGTGSQTRVEMQAQLQTNNKRIDRVPRLGVQFFLFRRGQAPLWTATISAPHGARDSTVQIAEMAMLAMEYFGLEVNKSIAP